MSALKDGLRMFDQSELEKVLPDHPS